MQVARGSRGLLAWALLGGLWPGAALAGSFDEYGLRFEIPGGFERADAETEESQVVPLSTAYAASLPPHYDHRRTETRLFLRPSGEQLRDVLMVMRVPGEARSAEDAVMQGGICKGFAEAAARVGHEPPTCKSVTAPSGVKVIDVRPANVRGNGTQGRRYSAFLARRDDLVVLALILWQDSEAEADRIWDAVIASLVSERPPPLEPAGSGPPSQHVLLFVLAPAVLLGLGWVWWRGRRRARRVPAERDSSPDGGPSARD